ncbi:hypothetical protein [Actinomadura sp. 6N118]|uniref:hypothetical protein n=1 Tax=Actinomadura sp. 6N118 TaxID=3375151 RepID=UPI0037BAB375
MEVEFIARPRGEREAMNVLEQFSQKLAGGYASIEFNGGIFTIGASHTGDMYDVAMAHTIIGHSLVIIWGVDASTAARAAEIARFIDERETVLWTSGPPPADGYYADTGPADLRELAAGRSKARPYWIREGGATTIVTAYAGVSAEQRRDVPGFVAPEVFVKGTGTSLDKGIHEDLGAHGFTGGKRYVIVNYRQSGHTSGTAPALDTGEEGFLQLMDAVARLGLVPVPMGEYDPYPRLGRTPKDEVSANLLRYWTWKSVDSLGRRAEARLLRVLVEKFAAVAAVGMRSGVTDLLAYVGIPTLSIDIHPRRGVVAKGWQRPLKRESVFPAYKVVSLMQGRQRERDKQERWAGDFGAQDLAVIQKALDLLTRGETMDWKAPQHPQDVTAIDAHAAGLLKEAEDRVGTLRRAAAYRSSGAADPTPKPSGKSGTSNMEDLKRMIDQEKQLGVSTGQTAANEVWLRDQRELADHLLDWLTDTFVQQTTEVHNAIRDLRELHALT